ncbi:hypothetical protein GCM10025857_14860 [Alicyclobacillus contaminans]|uniref:hypothetical protein n=1 Tax=Alicyclobacillus contaminans TaxID=392016 RepID=UPI000406C8E9|nr:hypothetical protein [Alicyclobacillus contaminans]GMA50129.1 hypothetical protein GCM10025857_14860 [Alicyclobacillus contaminans]
MGSAELLDQVWKLLANDATFLSLLRLTTSTDNATKATKIVKEEETDGIVTTSTIPMCLLYIRPGKADVRTPTVYLGKVVIDCFAKDGNTARKMYEQALALMQNWEPPGFFVSRMAYDTSFKTGITGVKGHRVYFDVSYFVG